MTVERLFAQQGHGPLCDPVGLGCPGGVWARLIRRFPVQVRGFIQELLGQERAAPELRLPAMIDACLNRVMVGASSDLREGVLLTNASNAALSALVQLAD